MMTDNENNSSEEESFLENDFDENSDESFDDDENVDERKKVRGASKTYIKQETFEKCEEMIDKLINFSLFLLFQF